MYVNKKLWVIKTATDLNSSTIAPKIPPPTPDCHKKYPNSAHTAHIRTIGKGPNLIMTLVGQICTRDQLEPIGVIWWFHLIEIIGVWLLNLGCWIWLVVESCWLLNPVDCWILLVVKSCWLLYQCSFVPNDCDFYHTWTPLYHYHKPSPDAPKTFCCIFPRKLSNRTWEAMTHSLSHLATWRPSFFHPNIQFWSKKTKPCATGWNQWNLSFFSLSGVGTYDYFHRDEWSKNEVKRF